MVDIIKPTGPETYIGNNQVFNANTGIAANRINLATQGYVNGQLLTYVTSPGNTVPTGLLSGASYYAVVANSSGLSLSKTPGGANIVITATSVSETGHTLYATINSSLVRVVANGNVSNTLHFYTNTGTEYANMTIANTSFNSSVVFVQKLNTDILLGNNMVALPIAWK